MSRHWIETALEIANLDYYANHLKEEMEKRRVPDEGSIPVPESKVSIGDVATCSFCHEENVKIGYVYGKRYPMCIACVPKELK